MGYTYWTGTIPKGTRVYTGVPGGRLTDLTRSIEISWTYRRLDGNNWWANFQMPEDYDPFNGVMAWVPEERIVGITEQYYGTTTKTTAPTSITGASIAEGTVSLSYSGAAPGTDNTITGYVVQYADWPVGGNAWGAWQALTEFTSTSGSGTFTAAVNPQRGAWRRYRMRTKGSAGASWYSDWSNPSNDIRTNRTPVIQSISASGVTYSKTPCMVMTLGAEPDGQTQKGWYRVNGGAWQSMSAVGVTGGKTTYKMPQMGVGTYNVEIGAWDVLNGAATQTITVEIKSPVFKRTISSGDLISTGTHKHIDEIQQLYALVNTQRAFYKLPALTVPSTIGLYAQWRAQMEQLMAGLDECVRVYGGTVPQRPTLTRSYPKADVVNFIRQYLQQV